MNQIYNNLPPKKIADATVQAFDSYYLKPLELNAGTLDAMKSFFTARGFDPLAAESVSVIIIKQANKDGYNPLQILDTLTGLDSVEISSLVAEIINYNRFKTSFLGYANKFTPNQEVYRNVVL